MTESLDGNVQDHPLVISSEQMLSRREQVALVFLKLLLNQKYAVSNPLLISSSFEMADQFLSFSEGK